MDIHVKSLVVGIPVVWGIIALGKYLVENHAMKTLEVIGSFGLLAAFLTISWFVGYILLLPFENGGGE